MTGGHPRHVSAKQGCAAGARAAHPRVLAFVVGGRLSRVARAIASRRGHDEFRGRSTTSSAMVLGESARFTCCRQQNTAPNSRHGRVAQRSCAKHMTGGHPRQVSAKQGCAAGATPAHPRLLALVVGGRLSRAHFSLRGSATTHAIAARRGHDGGVDAYSAASRSGRGYSSQVLPLRMRPDFFLFTPPHCLKKNAVP